MEKSTRKNRFWKILMKMKVILSLFLVIVTVIITSIFFGPPLSQIMSLDISADGKFVVSAHKNKSLYLWDIENQSFQLVSDNANVYSAQFENSGHNIVWQDLKNTVHIQNIKSVVIKDFDLFPTYGHAFKGEKYLAVNSENKVIVRIQDRVHSLKENGGSFIGYGKLFNIELSDDWKYLVTSGFGPLYRDEPEDLENLAKTGYKDLTGITLWDLANLKPIAKLIGHGAKAYATISPNGEYVVGVDEGSRNYVWKTSDPTKPMTENGDPGFGVRKNGEWDTTNVLPLPDDYIDPGHHYGILIAKFLDDTHYVTIYTYEPFAFLYEIGNPMPIKWFRLGFDPFPSVSDYTRNTSIDTAPSAGILVTGQEGSGGINVYQYNKEKQTLEKIWAADSILAKIIRYVLYRNLQIE